MLTDLVTADRDTIEQYCEPTLLDTLVTTKLAKILNGNILILVLRWMALLENSSVLHVELTLYLYALMYRPSYMGILDILCICTSLHTLSTT